MLLILKDPDPAFSVNADPHTAFSVNVDPCPVPDPDQKILQLKKILFLMKIAIYLSLGLHEGRSSNIAEHPELPNIKFLHSSYIRASFLHS